MTCAHATLIAIFAITMWIGSIGIAYNHGWIKALEWFDKKLDEHKLELLERRRK